MEAILIRRELTNDQWERIANFVPGKKGDKGRAGEDNRLFVDAVLWILPHRSAVARSAACLRQLEQCVRAV